MRNLATDQGPVATGYPTDLWTLHRVAEVIERTTGVHYHPGHVWRILRALGWSLQRPARRAVERDDDKVRGWVRDRWPRVKKNARRRRSWIVFEDESGVSLTPPLRRTWAPKGRTPVIRCRFNWKRLSMAAALAYRSDGSEAALVWHTHPGAYNDEVLIHFLTELHRHLGGDNVTLLWDGLPSHPSRKMAAFIASQRGWLVVEPLPAYAADLNPVEALWGNVKGRELANLCVDALQQTVDAAEAGLNRVGEDGDLPFAFLRQAGLSL